MLKLFLRSEPERFDPDVLQIGDDLRRKTFESEVMAYEVAHADSVLSVHVPRFYGVRAFERVFDQDGADVSDRYLLDCCYSIDYIEGDAIKAGMCAEWRARAAHLAQFERQMHAAGIGYTRDVSIFFPGDLHHFKFIDFAVRDVVADAEEQWMRL